MFLYYAKKGTLFCEVGPTTKRLCPRCRKTANQASAKLSKEGKNLRLRMKIRDNVELKARHIELSEQMKQLDLENALMMVNVINKSAELNSNKQINRKQN